MKKRVFYFLMPVIAMLGLLLIGFSPVAGQAKADCGEIMETALIAGQHIPVGSVSIENDEQYIYVTYQTDGEWRIAETHLDVAARPEDLKQTPKGNPIPGRFAYHSEHDPSVTQVTHTIDLSAWPPGTELYLAAHSVVVAGSGSETAWAEGLDFPGNNWAMYVAYQVQSCEPPPLEPGVINMQSPTIEVDEDGVSITLHLLRSNGSDGQVMVTLESSDITATGGDDYATVATVVTFDDGETEKTVEVFILDDLQEEDDEQFTVRITDVTGAELGADAATLITIIDDDQVMPE